MTTALTNQNPDPDIRFEHPLNIDFTIDAFIQDQDGLFWIGGENGLIRYDGYDCKYYKKGPDTLPSNFVHRITEDRDGVLWIGTINGLARFDKESGSFGSYQHDPDDAHSLSHNNTWSICEDKTGVLWVGTDKGLNKLNRANGTFDHYQHVRDDLGSLDDLSIWILFEDETGTLWIGTRTKGLVRFDKDTETIVRYTHNPDDPNSLSDNEVRVITQDISGILLIGTGSGGLNMLDTNTHTFTHYRHDPNDPTSLGGDSVTDIYKDRSGTLWIGCFRGGLGKFNRKNQTFTRYQHDPQDPGSLPPSIVQKIYEDHCGTLWIASAIGQVVKYNPQANRFKLYRQNPNRSDSLSSNNVLLVYEDRQGVVWVGTIPDGLNRFYPQTETFSHYAHDPNDPDSLPAEFVTAMLEDSSNILWVATSDGSRAALNIFDREKGKCTRRYVHDPQDPESLTGGRMIVCIIQDRDEPDILWLANLLGGLEKFDKRRETFAHYQHDPADSNGLSSDKPNRLYQDHNGVLWISDFSANSGISRFDAQTETFTHYAHDPGDPHSISSNFTRAILEDSAGRLWFGADNGLNRFDHETETFVHYTLEDELPGKVIYGILEDSAGCLWMSTNDGLVKFNPRDETFQVYKKGDGLQGDAFFERTYAKTKDGEMWFGGLSGLNRFRPEEIVDNPHVPPIVLTSIKQGGEQVDFGKDSTRLTQIMLDWKHNYFEFEFAALDYFRPEKNQYAYMLEGFDKDWYYAGNRRFGRYSNIPSGTYTLRIKGSNNDGVWNEEGLSIQVTVVPPLWESVLRESEERFRSLVETSSDWIWEVDKNGVYTYSSPKIKDILGYEPEQVIGKTPFDLMPPGKAERVAGLFQTAVRNQWPIVAQENEVIHQDGRLIVIETNGVPILDEDGILLGYRGVDRDVTQRKRAEEELRHLRNYLANIIDSMPSVLVGVDPDGKVTLWNRKAQQSTGIPAADAVGQPLAKAFPRLTAQMERVREAMQTRKVCSDPRQVYEKDGETHYEDVTVYPLLDDGVEGAVIRVDDVTEQVRLEEMMIQSEKMLSVGGLAAGMAHEINNPLSGMMQTADVMRNRLTNPDLPANQRAAAAAGTSMDVIHAFMEARGIPKMLERIRTSGLRAAEIVANMLSFARKSDSTFSTHNLTELLDQSMDLAGSDYDLKKKFDFRQIEIVREYEQDLPLVPCEGSKIQQVFLNVLRNGAQAMQEEGREKMGEEPRFILRLAHEKEAGQVRVEIEDNGPGMEEATRKRVFEPFFTTKPVGVGTGLGLSVSYFIIAENHGGEMSVESTPGEGTTFIIRLPVERKKS